MSANREPRGVAREQDKDTGEALREAARAEFAEHGFGGTDSNKIARRAGFAPQTFYRWYRDKREVFVAVYQAWEEEEGSVLAQLVMRGAKPRAFAEAIIAHHRAHLQFRRSLRSLSVSDPIVRKARAESRVRQADRVRAWLSLSKRRMPAIYAALLQIERMADAAAEGELADLELSDDLAVTIIADLIDRLGGKT